MTSSETTALRGNSAMAGIKPPKPLIVDQDAATNWKNWLQQFEWYAIAVQLYDKPPEVQAATFMATIGQEAIRIFNSFNLTERQQKNIIEIKDKYNNYFIPKINVSFERYNFFKVVQKENESFDEFLTVIRNLAKTCEFEKLHDELIKDKIIFGIRSEQVREKLLTENNLDLDKAITICKSSEQATKQLQQITKTETEVNALKLANDSKDAIKGTQEKTVQHLIINNGKKSAKKKVNEVNIANESDSESDSLFINQINEGIQNDWKETIMVNNVKFAAKLDTGAQCNVLSKGLLSKLKSTINPTNVKYLTTFSNHKMLVIGETVLKCQIKNKFSEVKFKVVNENVPPVLGNKSCQELGLIVRVDNLNNDETVCTKD
ncbi:hypothetical protein FQR65_LT14189 [Abscondita terminalis]|nr:hypothetical protein FQR65_LT14189 [Abscondita terminalis]